VRLVGFHHAIVFKRITYSSSRLKASSSEGTIFCVPTTKMTLGELKTICGNWLPAVGSNDELPVLRERVDAAQIIIGK